MRSDAYGKFSARFGAGAAQSVKAPGASEAVVIDRLIIACGNTQSLTLDYGAGHTAFGPALMEAANKTVDLPDLGIEAPVGQEVFVNVVGAGAVAMVYYSVIQKR